ncbi:dTDP-4-amino-4,6-dideoxygalactose transaminase [Alkalibaculum bacchi]|uniref:dTDP-4-amino-4,6-dideoxygalactose transaminase n=1 Tax=Alkalibaculum bacchi TaxID=645887 RepID=A0A366IDT2_9FIRM|nr:DegT/DnrJ/EryC1/StrS aminotransferase family protein [Alkalibaculum bacchi]RBP69098.1 dTDP-4-amino-4,6-dideoxygalactose transaminase [Alkalibaculum bacchi]
MNISFSPPDITQTEIDEVVDTLKSGWITTGPKTKLFEKQIAEYCNTTKAVCMNSATACMEMTLRLLGIGEGDEVITSAYTYTSSASVIHHVGARIVLVDTAKDSFHLDYNAVERAITDKTKAIIPVDIAGVMCDYDKLLEVVNSKKHLFKPSNEIQSAIGRIAIVADAAHSFGANYKNKMSGEVADFTCFSFHAVKNLTTAEGGAVTWKEITGVQSEDIYNEFMLLTLHGQSKDALAKTTLGGWEYDIVYPAYKCNMTDIMASLGLGQFKRYDEILKRRKEIISIYDEEFKGTGIKTLNHYDKNYNSNGHLYLVQIVGKSEQERNRIIEEMAARGVSTNVHYKPLPMHTAYKQLGFNIMDYPNSYNQYVNEITLPLHTLLSDEEIKYVISSLKDVILKI